MVASAAITSNVKEIQALVERLEIGVSEPSMEFWLATVMKPFIEQRIKSRFDSEGDEVTGKWAALSPATEEIRDNLGYPASHPINVRSGALEAFVQTSSMFSSPAYTQLSFPDNNTAGSLEVFEKLANAQWGGEATKAQTNAPPRPVLALGPRDMVFAQGSLIAFIISFIYSTQYISWS